jgi:hypothetical protein
MGSAGFFIAGIVILALVAAGVGFYLYQRKGNGDTARLFAPRPRRLAYVERTALGGAGSCFWSGGMMLSISF